MRSTGRQKAAIAPKRVRPAQSFHDLVSDMGVVQKGLHSACTVGTLLPQHRPRDSDDIAVHDLPHGRA